MKFSSYHVHTNLCKHARGGVQDYIKIAERDGCSSLGFSDHCPYPDSTWLDTRMIPDIAKSYIKSIRDIDKITSFPVFAGFECEWDKKYHNWYKDFLLGECGADFLVYGSHWINVNGNYEYIPDIRDKKILYKYLDLTLNGIRSGLYAYLAHPDLYTSGFKCFDKDLKHISSEIIKCAIEYNLPLEINGSGFYKPRVIGENGYKYPYPLIDFWELARDLGATIICNSDAHDPENVIKHTIDAWNFAKKLNIEPLDSGVALGFTKG